MIEKFEPDGELIVPGRWVAPFAESGGPADPVLQSKVRRAAVRSLKVQDSELEQLVRNMQAHVQAQRAFAKGSCS